MMKQVNIKLLYQLLSDFIGPSGWWPADSKEEIILGAILVQNTSWHNAQLALNNLRTVTDLDPKIILSLDLVTLQEVIRPAGFYKNKSLSIKEVVSWFESHDWDYDDIMNKYNPHLRQELLKLRGVGQETADVFLVYIFDQVLFIADAYSRRLFGYLEDTNYQTYDQLKKTVTLPADFTGQDAQEFHGLIDEFAKLYLKDEGKMKWLKESVKS